MKSSAAAVTCTTGRGCTNDLLFEDSCAELSLFFCLLSYSVVAFWLFCHNQSFWLFQLSLSCMTFITSCISTLMMLIVSLRHASPSQSLHLQRCKICSLELVQTTNSPIFSTFSCSLPLKIQPLFIFFKFPLELEKCFFLCGGCYPGA